MVLSSDAAHSVHPNYPEVHQPMHKVTMNAGVVFKVAAQQRYMSDAPGLGIFRDIATKAGVKMQDYIGRNDMGSGSTIGPYLAGLTGIKTVDVGIPLWSMHSIRETSGVLDVFLLKKLYVSFWLNFQNIKQANLLSD